MVRRERSSAVAGALGGIVCVLSLQFGCNLGTVTPGTTERVLFLRNDVNALALAPNSFLAGPILAADLGGTDAGDGVRELLGAQHGRASIILTDAGRTGIWIRDLSDGTEHILDPGPVAPAANGPHSASLAADGSVVVWLAQGAGGNVVYRSQTDGSAATPIYTDLPPDDAQQLALSPDGGRVAFITSLGEVRIMPVRGGVAIPVDLGAGYQPQAMEWMDDASLAVAFRDGDTATPEDEPAIMRAYSDGIRPTAVIYGSASGLRSAPVGVSVDRAGNILFDEGGAAGGDRGINRLDAPAYISRVTIVGGELDAQAPMVLAW